MKCTVELLERRTLLCATAIDPVVMALVNEARVSAASGPSEQLSAGTGLIDWENEGNATNDSDGFNATFGADAELGREVVRGVIRAFEATIVDFNYQNPPDNQFHLTLSVGGTGFGGAAAVTSLHNGRPKTGAVGIAGGTVGQPQRGYFLDPTPDDYAEFVGPIRNAFAADSLSASPAFNRVDLYSLVAHEIAHTLGMSNVQRFNDQADPTPTSDPQGNGSGFFWAFDGAQVRHLMTSFNGTVGGGSDAGAPIHTASVSANINFNSINWRGAEDLGNATGAPMGTRYLIPDTLALMYRDAYTFVTMNPSERPTFYAVYSEDTQTLLVRGGTGASDDAITISRVGSQLRVSVDVGNDVPGTGALPGVGNLPAFTFFFESADVDRIIVRGGEGNDTINLDGVHANIPVTLQGGLGDDTYNLGSVSNSLDGILSMVRVEDEIVAPGSIDRLVLHDRNNADPDTYSVSTGLVQRTAMGAISYGGLERIQIESGPGGATFDVTALNFDTQLTINAGNGNDNINIATGNLNNVAEPITINGEAGTADTITLNDATSSANDDYIINSTLFEHVGFGPMTYGTVETVTLNASSGNNGFTIDSTPSGTTWVINAGNGDDEADITFGLGQLRDARGPIDFRGDGGDDNLDLWDDLNTAHDRMIFDNNEATQVGFGGLDYNATTETISLFLGSGNNEIDVDSTAAAVETHVFAGAGTDLLDVCEPSRNLNDIAGELFFHGQVGSDSVLLRDDFVNSNHNYTIELTTVSRTGFAGIQFFTTELMTLEASGGNNNVAIDASSLPTQINVDGNAGADTFNIAQAGGSLDAIDGVMTLTGGAGTDTAVFFDSSSNDVDSYFIQGTLVATSGMDSLPTLNSMEGITLHAANGNNTIDVETTAAGVPITVNGNGGNDTLRVTFPTGRLENAPAAITFDGGIGTDTGSIWDDFSNDNATYTITSGNVAHSGFGGFNYNATVENVNLNADSGNSSFNVNATLAGPTLTLSGLAGNDTFTIGNGDIDGQILGNVTIVGGVGASDTVVMNDTTDGIGSDIYTIQSASIRKFFGGTTSWNTTSEFVNVNGSGNSDLYEILGSTAGVLLTINGGNGNDQFQLAPIGAGNLETLPGAIVVNGQGGTNDTVTLHDSGSTASDSCTIANGLVTHSGFGGLMYATLEGVTLNAASGANTIDISTTASAPVTVNAANGTDTINVNETAAAAAVTIAPSAGDDTVRINSDGIGSAQAIFNATQRIGQLTIANGGTATIASGANKVLTFSTFTITGGILNANDNDIIVNYSGSSPLTTLRNLIASGYNGGAWNGGGINSASAASSTSTGLGIAESADLFTTFPATFSGQDVDNTSVLIKYTAYGDTNLDGTVNLADFNRLASNFGLAGRRWTDGDSDYDTDVDLADFNRLAANFGATGFRPTVDDLMSEIAQRSSEVDAKMLA